MSYIPPNRYIPPGPLLTPFSPEALGIPIAATTTAGPTTSSTTIRSGTAFLCAFRITNPVLVQAMFWMNGNVVVGHFDAGIYTVAGNRVLSTGSTAQAIVAGLQVVSVAPTLLGPGPYYLALATATDSTTIFRSSWSIAADGRVYGTFRADSAATGAVMPLPPTLTVSLTNGVVTIPVFGLSTRTLVTS